MEPADSVAEERCHDIEEAIVERDIPHIRSTRDRHVQERLDADDPLRNLARRHSVTDVLRRVCEELQQVVDRRALLREAQLEEFARIVTDRPEPPIEARVCLLGDID